MPKGIKNSNPNGRYQVKSLAPRHRAILEWMRSNPTASLKECAEYFGHSPTWIYMIVNTDLFQEALRKREDEYNEEVIVPLRAKLMGVAHRAVEKLGEQVDESDDPDFILASADKTLHRLGYAPTRGPAVEVALSTQENVFVVDSDTLASAREKLASLRESPTIEGEVAPALPSPD